MTSAILGLPVWFWILMAAGGGLLFGFALGYALGRPDPLITDTLLMQAERLGRESERARITRRRKKRRRDHS